MATGQYGKRGCVFFRITIIRNCDKLDNRNATAKAVGILHFFFERDSVSVVLRAGGTITEPTPANMTGTDHLFSIIRKLA